MHKVYLSIAHACTLAKELSIWSVLLFSSNSIYLGDMLNSEFYMLQFIAVSYSLNFLCCYLLEDCYYYSWSWIASYTSHSVGFGIELLSLLLWDHEFTRKVCRLQFSSSLVFGVCYSVSFNVEAVFFQGLPPCKSFIWWSHRRAWLTERGRIIQR